MENGISELDLRIQSLRIKNDNVQRLVRLRDEIEHIIGMLKSEENNHFYVGTENHSVYCKVPDSEKDALAGVMQCWVVTLEHKIVDELDRDEL